VKFGIIRAMCRPQVKTERREWQRSIFSANSTSPSPTANRVKCSLVRSRSRALCERVRWFSRCDFVTLLSR
jgi:hypothetical protein